MRSGWTLRIFLLRFLALYPAAVTVVLVVLPVLRPRDGPFALVAVLSVHLALSAVLLVPVAGVRDAGWLRVGLVALLAVAALRFGGDWLSVPLPGGAATTGPELRVLSWNLEIGARDGRAAVEGVRAIEADIVALQELTPEAAAAIEADPILAARYPHRVLASRPNAFGNGVLSSHPIVASEDLETPEGIVARIDVDGQFLTIINAHPFPGRIHAIGGLSVPVSFDPGVRDDQLRSLRTRVELIVATGEPLLVIGDFNVAPTEAAYGDLAAGLRDVHGEVGWGPGWTWRPSRIEAAGIGLLRIDQALVGPGLDPIASDVDCSLPGDHCRLIVRIALSR